MSRSKSNQRRKRAWGTSGDSASGSGNPVQSGYVSMADSDLTPREYVRLLLQHNRSGLTGFVLSVIQLVGHISWIILVQSLVASGSARNLSSDDVMAWVIVSLLTVSTVLTMISMFVCLFFGLRRSPRLLPLLGLGVSFFTGSFVTFLILLG